MRTTINLDDELLARAQELTGITERTALIHEALRQMIQREAGRRLARLGGIAPDFEVPPRRKPLPDPPGERGEPRRRRS